MGPRTSYSGSYSRAVRQTVKLLSQVKVSPPYPPLGPHPVQDTMGYSIAIAMVLKSRDPGRYADYQQFETIRKLRSGFSNVYMASSIGVASLRTIGGDKVKHFLNDCPTHSLWFERFTRGCLSRMGQIVRQDMAVSLGLMHAFLTRLDQEWVGATTVPEKSLIASLGAYASIAFCGSFRGSEVFMVDLYGLRKYYQDHLSAGGKEYLIIPLLGRFKNEIGEQYHLTPLVAITNSGLNVKQWVKRLLDIRTAEKRHHGPAFGTPRGEVASAAAYEREILERFQSIQEQHPDLIAPDVIVLEEYGISRSFRRGATSEARARGVSPEDIDLANRWCNFESAKGHRPRLAMRDHYADIRLLIP
jgi:hypothetical protein